MNTKELVKTIETANEEYYTSGAYSMPDFEYDKLKEKLRAIDPRHPLLSQVDSRKVAKKGAPKKYKHMYPILSLENVYETEDTAVSGAIDKMTSMNAILKDVPNYIVEYKLDGCSAVAYYDGGKLLRVLTRGSGGDEGEDVTANLINIEGLPSGTRDLVKPTTMLVIRGEVVIRHSEFERINSLLPPEEAFSHPRSLVAGTMRSRTRQRDRELLFIAHEVRYKATADATLEMGIDSKSISHSDDMQRLQEVGFHTAEPKLLADTSTKIRCIASTIGQMRSSGSLGVAVDGIVIKVDNYAQRSVYADTSHHPTWAFAFKYIPERVETTLREIKYQVGRSGQLTPVAVFDPVVIDGSRITNASLHNEKIITDMDIVVGDTITIEKAGHIIPQVVSSKHDENNRLRPVPHCPVCGEHASGGSDSPSRRYYCGNDECPGKDRNILRHALGKSGLNVMGFGEELCNKLSDAGYTWDRVMCVPIVTRDEQEEFASVLGTKLGFPLFVKLEKAIAKAAYDTPLRSWISALGIRLVGKTEGANISSHVADIDELVERYDRGEDLGCSGAVANECLIQEFRFVKIIQDVCRRWRAYNREFNIVSDNRIDRNSVVEKPLAGKAFVITGELEFERGHYECIIVANGGVVRGSVSKKTSYLLKGENPGSKLAKAIDLGVPVISAEDLMKMI
ncbi:MAG: NAD-dependent DNA ligase LigA [Tannerellaceae bacterium]